MSLIANGAGESAKSFYNGVATQSLRFDKGSSAYLSRTPAGASNQKTWTWSCWLKRGNLVSGRIFDAGANDENWTTIGFSNDQIYAEHRVSDSTVFKVFSTALLRDTSAWYHIVVAFDTANSTASDRLKLYINGVEATYASTAYGSINTDTYINSTTVHHFSRFHSDTQHFDGYLAEANLIDGAALAPSSFGETKNGVWIPIDTSGLTFGTNGFRLQFADNAVGTPENEGVVEDDNIGRDTSGEHNHWTSSNIVASDCAMPDSPENNFATLNPLVPATYATYSEGNLKLSHSSNGWAMSFGTFAVSSGKWYFELVHVAGSINTGIGITLDNVAGATSDGNITGGYMYTNDGTKYINGTSSSYGDAYATGEVVACALDLDNGTLTFYNENVSQGEATTGLTGTFCPFASIHYATTNIVVNFGQDSSFAGNETAQGNTDGKGIGDFYYAPPSGFLALCTSNISEPTIGANSLTQADDYFETVLWAGNGTDDTAIAVNFQPDFTWIKQRTSTAYHNLSNSTSGATKALFSNDTDAEGTNSDRLKAFTSTGFTLGDASDVNAGSNTYVAWNWKANGSTATATISESGDNPAAVVQANPTAGFSLITYTGTGDAGTIAHGLGAVPTMMIIKNRDVTDSWAVYHGANTAAPATDYLILNTSAATADSATMWADTAPTDSVFTVHDSHQVNANGEKYVAYVFADIEGYSKMGSYTANNDADGPFVYTGFRPAFVMFKDTTNTSAWIIKDSVRGTVNPNLPHLAVHTTAAEGSTADCDFLSNGFKIRQADAAISFANKAAAKMIYMAFAEQSFKYANAK